MNTSFPGPPPEHGDLLTIPEAAGALRCHPNTIRAWIRQGRLVPVIMGDERVNLLKKEDIHALRRPLEQAGVIVREDRHAFPVVGIGASAGGLEAVSAFLEKLPTDLGLAYVYVPHIEEGQEPMLAELLRRKTSMPVIVAENGMKLDHDRLYIGPGGMHLSVVNSTITLRTVPARSGAASRPIDAFLAALAQEYQNNAIGIVLSGRGMDGTEGLRAIKAEDGLTMVQDASALDPGMPQSAVEAGIVDLILRPEDMGRALAELVKRLYSDGKARIPGKYENELRRILGFLEEQRGVDFTQYKENTIHRRIIRRMVLSNCRKLSDYSVLLRGTPTEVETLYNDLLINVTSFFRDPEFHKALTERIFPALLKDRTGNEPLRIWVPACAGGEEVVSIAITLLEYLGDLALSTPVQIFATDLNERSIEKARMGIYKKNALQSVSPARIKRFFTHVDGHFQVIKSIRDMCVFSKHDLLKDPPFSKQDLISCQNVLIYLDSRAQERVLKSFHYALKPHGVLALGKSETTANAGEIFVQPDRAFKFYHKKPRSGGTIALDVQYRSSPAPAGVVATGMHSVSPVPGGADLDAEMDRVLLQRYVPPSVLVNDDLEILRFRGVTAPFLAPSTGRASLKLMRMVRDELAFELRGLLRKVKKEHMPARKSAISVEMDRGPRDVGLEVLPIGGKREPHFLILFMDEGPTPLAEKATGRLGAQPDARTQRIARLEQELRDAREQIRTISEESESMMQDLQSANEEVVSSNEELQSMNEELETSKEELQSINEEFATINEELQVRNDALLESEERYRRLIDLMPVAVYTCDTDGYVRLFNEAAVRLWGRKPVPGETRWSGAHGLRAADGTPLTPDRSPMAVAIQETRAMTDVELKIVRPNGEQRAVLSNPTPLYDANGRLNGAINVLVDITDRTENQRQLDLITKVGKLGIWDWNIVDDTITWTDAVYAIHGVEKGSFVPTMSGYHELIHPGDRERVGRAIENTLENDAPYVIEFRTLNRTGEVNWVFTDAVLLRDGARPVRMLGGTMNITDRKRAEAELLESEERFKAVYERAPFGIMLSTAPDARVVDANPAALAMLGLTREELIGKTSIEAGISVDAETRQRQIEELQRTGHLGEAEVRLRHRRGHIVTVRVTGDLVSLAGRSYNLVVLEDITERKAARAAERRLASIVESSEDAIFTKDLQGTITSWNSAAERIFGYSAAEIIGRPCAPLYPVDRHEEETGLMDRLKTGGRVEHFETVRLRKDGSPVEVAITLSPLRNEIGEIVGASKSIRDITESKRAREAVRKSEERFHLLADNIAQLAWIAEPDGDINWYNKRWFQYSGTTLEEMRGWGWQKIHHPEHVHRVTAKFKAHITSEVNWEDTFPLKGADGKYRWFLSRAFPIRDHDGRVSHWFGTNTDVTDEREAREALMRSEERFRMLADNMSQMAYVADAAGRITWVNRRWTDFTGMGVEEMNDGGWSRAVDPAHFKGMVDSYALAQEAGEPWEHIFRLRSTAGVYRWFLSRSVPIFGEDGKVERWFGTNTDITEQKLAEEALQDSAKHKDHFLATLAHELRNPLAPLKNGLQLMELAPDDPATMEMTRSMMVRQLDHMVRLVDDLMDLSRISRGKIQLIKEPVELCAVIATAIETSRPLIERNAHRLEVDLGPEGMLMDGDSARLTQVVTNLLNNAAKYTTSGGLIQLSARAEEDRAVIRVKDNGIGIAATDLPRVFDMFSQVDPAQKTQAGGGLGIGLNIVLRLVELHGGTVEGRSEGLGHGSEFIVRLPLLSTKKAAAPLVRTPASLTASERRVLIVDDNQDAALTMSMVISRRGHVVEVAHDGLEAVEKLPGFRPDIVLMDIGMPRLNGYDACVRMRTMPEGQGITIVALSGWGQEEDRRRSEDAGFDHHIVKPVDRATLERVIAEAKPSAAQ